MKYSVRGFTIVEMLVVVAIISILLTIAAMSFSDVRVNARDKIRLNDVSQTVLAMRLYAAQNDTFLVTDTGYSRQGRGWLSYSDTANYDASIADGLVDSGFLSKAPADPFVEVNTLLGSGGHRPYMMYFINASPTEGVCVFAQLENPTSEQLEAFNLAPVTVSVHNSLRSYNMNYGLCVQ